MRKDVRGMAKINKNNSKAEIIKRLIDIVNFFERINRRDYSYFVDEVIENIAKGSNNHDLQLETGTKTKTEGEIIKNYFGEMSELSDQLEEVELTSAAVVLDKLRLKMMQDFKLLDD